MEKEIKVEDRQLVVAYKEYRTYNDPAYEFKNDYFDKHPKFSLGINGTKVIFETFYKQHIMDGHLVLVDGEDRPITEYYGINGRFFLRLTPKGIEYVEQTYPFLL